MNLYIIGAGDFGREVLQYAREAFVTDSSSRVAGFLDDGPDALAGYNVGVEVVGRVAEVVPRDDDRFIVAVGDPRTRCRLAAEAAHRGARFHTLVHPSAWVAPSARLDAGCVICPFAFVGVDARLGENVVLNTFASAGHDAILGSYTVLAPYAVVNGRVQLGDEVFLGTHATVTYGQHVGSRSKVAAGSVVTRAVPDDALAVGNPAKSRVMYAP